MRKNILSSYSDEMLRDLESRCIEWKSRSDHNYFYFKKEVKKWKKKLRRIRKEMERRK